jgi:hypothetical protein
MPEHEGCLNWNRDRTTVFAIWPTWRANGFAVVSAFPISLVRRTGTLLQSICARDRQLLSNFRSILSTRLIGTHIYLLRSLNSGRDLSLETYENLNYGYRFKFDPADSNVIKIGWTARVLPSSTVSDQAVSFSLIARADRF